MRLVEGIQSVLGKTCVSFILSWAPGLWLDYVTIKNQFFTSFRINLRKFFSPSKSFTPLCLVRFMPYLKIICHELSTIISFFMFLFAYKAFFISLFFASPPYAKSFCVFFFPSHNVNREMLMNKSLYSLNNFLCRYCRRATDVVLFAMWHFVEQKRLLAFLIHSWLLY